LTMAMMRSHSSAEIVPLDPSIIHPLRFSLRFVTSPIGHLAPILQHATDGLKKKVLTIVDTPCSMATMSTKQKEPTDHGPRGSIHTKIGDRARKVLRAIQHARQLPHEGRALDLVILDYAKRNGIKVAP
jgi:hypothetical protein